jgi:uncharacterized protein (TIGR02145 family)
MYNGYTIQNGNLCPLGWHIPTSDEYNILSDYLGGWLIACGKLKSTGNQYWNGGNTAATNSSGFSGLPGGARDVSGLNQIGYYCHLGTNTLNDEGNGYNLRYLDHNAEYLGYTSNINISDGNNIRCILD